MSSLLSFGTTAPVKRSLKKSSKKTNTTSLKSKTVPNSKVQYVKQFVHKMLEIPPTIRLFHWKTESYAQHKATDSLMETLNEIVDKYVETLLGKTHVKLDMNDYHTLHVTNLENVTKLEEYTQSIIDFLIEIHKKLDMEKDVDLLNLRDEMIGDLNKFKYLLRLK